MRLNWKKDWTLLVVLFLVLRLVYAALGAVAAAGAQPQPLASGPIYAAAGSLLRGDAFSEAFVNIWLRWDSGWYLKIAAFGYDAADGSIAFQPLYPALARLLDALIGNELLSALLIASLACLAVLLLFYEVALGEGLSREAALQAVFFLAFFPSAFFLCAAYTDSLFLALALGAWLLARRRSWLAAGLLGGLATLTRLQGALLTPVLLWAFLADCANASASKPLEGARQVAGLLVSRDGWRRLSAWLKRPAWIGVLFPALAFAAYSLWLRWSGLGGIPTGLEQHWGIRTVMPWEGFRLFLERLFTTQRVFIDWIDLAMLILVLGLLVVGLFCLDPALSLYNWLSLALFFMRGTPPHLLDSFNRYFLSLFPAFFMLGQMRSRALRLALWVLSFGLQVFLLLGFLDWRWVA